MLELPTDVNSMRAASFLSSLILFNLFRIFHSYLHLTLFLMIIFCICLLAAACLNYRFRFFDSTATTEDTTLPVKVINNVMAAFGHEGNERWRSDVAAVRLVYVLWTLTLFIASIMIFGDYPALMSAQELAWRSKFGLEPGVDTPAFKTFGSFPGF